MQLHPRTGIGESFRDQVGAEIARLDAEPQRQRAARIVQGTWEIATFSRLDFAFSPGGAGLV
ncbi:hypothetical protein, partial [Amycolatopsis sp. NPDC003676]